MTEFYHKDLSYVIIGCAYEVYNEIGYGHKEVIYQRGLEAKFKEKSIRFSSQVLHKVKVVESVVGRVYLDFLVEDLVVVEIKRDGVFSPAHVAQVYGYLKATGLQLGLLIHFRKEGVRCRRVVNAL
jgi:GxxExxY protein